MRRYNILIFLVIGHQSSGQTSFELNAGSRRFGIDLITTQIWKQESAWSVFSRNRAVKYYEDQRMAFLTVNSLIYSFKSGLGINGNLIGDDQHFYSSLGLQWERLKKNLYIYVLSTYAVSISPYQEDYIFIIYKLQVSSGLKLFLHQEYYF
jgi:hypothetical protein